MNITVVGAGYVGLSVATLLSRFNDVTLVEVVEKKVDMINARISPIQDSYIEDFFANRKLNLRATLPIIEAYTGADFVVIATPTNYDDVTHKFDTHMVEDVISYVYNINKEIPMVIKSTIPVGFTDEMNEKYKGANILFSPEFLREGNALYDNLYPSRIIVSHNEHNLDLAIAFAKLLSEAAFKEPVQKFYMPHKEAESVKLFANTYLAVRVAYFNELDTYAETMGLNPTHIISGMCADPRIGDGYNNPSFGYGGYCLPKDTKQLKNNFEGIPQNMISAVVDANNTRKRHIADMILKRNPSVVGIYRLVMKSGSDNFRSAAIFDIIDMLNAAGVKVIVFEPMADKTQLQNIEFVNNLKEFKEMSDIIVTNRTDINILDVREKVYTRDIFNNN